MGKYDPLPERYRKALALIEAGELSHKDIASSCGIPLELFYSLCDGTAKNYGTIQEKFTEEYERISRQMDKDIRKLAKSCRKKTLYLIYSYLTKHKDVKKTDKSLVSTLTAIASGLSKVTPNVEIGSFSYTKGLSAEDIYAEFKRLNGLASDRGAVQAPSEAGTGEVSLPPGPRGAVTEEPEDPIL